MVLMVRLESSIAVDDSHEVGPHQRDVGRLDGDVGAGADRDAHVRGGEGRGVVDAVTDHADERALLLQRRDLRGLLAREDLRR